MFDFVHNSPVGLMRKWDGKLALNLFKNNFSGVDQLAFPSV
ncbi:hypothetical protein HMPREF9151_00820 [Hoylesella saccharolytica F0055]|uniref:Uncharacterized protein n=1 Tax=Hoylesella saccharolytica F0055 TaxID=1127699 RepID=L1NGD1_9BACT|nr:hypothetical protein HMPREF9151_00820 [Hoylesella saccharolytica F0055]